MRIPLRQSEKRRDVLYDIRGPVSARAAALEAEGQWLHAVGLAFEHPRTGERVEFESPYPDDLQHALDAVRELD